eukprot:TRINITY_DN83_c3_g1_i1.p1 TRINITY_DN83_c3_g1~~TRINITY_DN83_c3_g1_i1.p1  ORF type:complete len:920 (+),score=187.60 TRINITY_DN83_c3_g1_i1:134-2893(+)
MYNRPASRKNKEDEEVQLIVKHLNERLADDAFVAEYIPIDPDNVLDALSNGMVFCAIINKISPGMINLKYVKRKPKNMYEASQNQQLVIDSALKLGIKVVGITAMDLYEKKTFAILGILWQLMRYDSVSVRNISVQNHPQMIGLKKKDENTEQFSKLAPEELLLRWATYHVNGVDPKVRIQSYKNFKDGKYFLLLLNHIDPEKCPIHPPLIDVMSLRDRFQMAIDFATKLGVLTVFFTPESMQKDDLSMAFLANIFRTTIEKHPLIHRDSAKTTFGDNPFEHQPSSDRITTTTTTTTTTTATKKMKKIKSPANVTTVTEPVKNDVVESTVSRDSSLWGAMGGGLPLDWSSRITKTNGDSVVNGSNGQRVPIAEEEDESYDEEVDGDEDDFENGDSFGDHSFDPLFHKQKFGHTARRSLVFTKLRNDEDEDSEELGTGKRLKRRTSRDSSILEKEANQGPHPLLSADYNLVQSLDGSEEKDQEVPLEQAVKRTIIVEDEDQIIRHQQIEPQVPLGLNHQAIINEDDDTPTRASKEKHKMPNSPVAKDRLIKRFRSNARPQLSPYVPDLNQISQQTKDRGRQLLISQYRSAENSRVPSMDGPLTIEGMSRTASMIRRFEDNQAEFEKSRLTLLLKERRLSAQQYSVMEQDRQRSQTYGGKAIVGPKDSGDRGRITLLMDHQNRLIVRMDVIHTNLNILLNSNGRRKNLELETEIELLKKEAQFIEQQLAALREELAQLANRIHLNINQDINYRKLFVTVGEGMELPVCDVLSKDSDPFVIVRHLDASEQTIVQFRTRVIKHNNKDPYWDETMEFHDFQFDHKIEVSLWDFGSFGVDFMGQITFDFLEITPGSSDWYPVADAERELPMMHVNRPYNNVYTFNDTKMKDIVNAGVAIPRKIVKRGLGGKVGFSAKLRLEFECI